MGATQGRGSAADDDSINIQMKTNIVVVRPCSGMEWDAVVYAQLWACLAARMMLSFPPFLRPGRKAGHVCKSVALMSNLTKALLLRIRQMQVLLHS